MQSESEPEVRTVVGVLRGCREAGLAVFRGIPYAEPPVGGLRFAAPQPGRRWEGVRPAVAYGPPPPQPGAFGMSPQSVGDDWLTLNVWTPAPDPAARLPVMVWIPGGGYLVGCSGLPEYDGGHLAGSGTVARRTGGAHRRLGVREAAKHRQARLPTATQNTEHVTHFRLGSRLHADPSPIPVALGSPAPPGPQRRTTGRPRRPRPTGWPARPRPMRCLRFERSRLDECAGANLLPWLASRAVGRRARRRGG